MEENVQRPYVGLHMDSSPQDQPKDTYRYALNAVNETSEGDKGFISNEKGNMPSVKFTEGFLPLGDCYIGDDVSAVLLTNPKLEIDEIGYIDKNHIYHPIVQAKLNFSMSHQIDATYRVRRGSEKVIYFTDGLNIPRFFNFDRPRDFYSNEYKDWIDNGHVGPEPVNNKWAVESFGLIQYYSAIPIFKQIKVLGAGELSSGSYSFGIFYIDDNLNSTECINVCNPVNIYVDELGKSFQSIRGSNNSLNQWESFGKANKSIHVTFDNLDSRYPYYKVAVIKYVSGDGSATEVLLSNLISTNNPTFVYYGQDRQFSQISLDDIAITTNRIDNAQHIEQLENKLLLANVQNKKVNWLKFQKHASKISSTLVTKEIILNNIKAPGNPKNPLGPYDYIGYMPGEVYSFGICYIFKDGDVSPVNHIPGLAVPNPTGMQVYKCLSTYPKLHKGDIADYWGVDSAGNPLEGTPIRHHKFPFRDEINLPLFDAIDNDDNSGTIGSDVFKITAKILTKRAILDNPLVEGLSGINVEVFYQFEGDPTIYYGIVFVDLTRFDDPLILEIEDDFSTGESLDDFKQSWNGIPLTGTTTNPISTNNYLSLTGRFTLDNLSLKDIVRTVEPSSEGIGVTSGNPYRTNIMGIRFDNITVPEEYKDDIIGYYIVRNESQISDRIVVDNALVGKVVKAPAKSTEEAAINGEQYIAFSWFNYKIRESGNGYVKPTILHDWLYIFSPEHQINGNQIAADKIRMRTTLKMDTGDLWFGTRYIDDVQVGTTYNAEAHRNKDSDGFDLAMRYRETTITASENITSIGDFSIIENYHVLAGAFQQADGNMIFNASCDNKIMISRTSNAEGAGQKKLWGPDDKANLFYHANLVNNPTDAYADFLSRTYYKEHNNLIYLSNKVWDGTTYYNTNDIVTYSNKIYIAFRPNKNVVPTNTINDDWRFLQDNSDENVKRIFHGDSYVSPITPITSSLYDIVAAKRKRKKKSWWQFVVGSLLIVAGVVATVFSLGIAAPVSIAMIAAGIGFIASGVNSGMTIDALYELFTVHYKTGLKNIIVDQHSYSVEQSFNENSWGDDVITWFHDRVSNVFIESRINMYLRNGYTVGSSDFCNAPESCGGQPESNILWSPTLNNEGVVEGVSESVGGGTFMLYLTNKMTSIDKEQSDGRLYRGFSMTEVYQVNPDYMRFNKEKLYYHLPAEYTINVNDPEHFVHRIMYSEESYKEELTDNYRVFLPNNYKDIEGEFGPITGLTKKDNKLYIFTKESLWYLPQNLQQQVTGELMTVIGTGEFFAINPQKILDEKSGCAGTTDKKSILVTRFGIFYVSEIEGKIYQFSERLQEISRNGVESWFKNNLKEFFNNQYFKRFNQNYMYAHNPISDMGVHTTFDTRYKRLIITKLDYLFLDDWSKVYLYSDTEHEQEFGDFIIDEQGQFNIVSVNGLELIPFNNTEYFENKSWTVSYDVEGQGWTGFHSYLPNYYLTTPNNMYSLWKQSNDNYLYKHNIEGLYNTYYGIPQNYILEIISLSNPLVVRTWEDITLQISAKKYITEQESYISLNDRIFDRVIMYNSKQSSGELELIQKIDSSEDFFNNQITDVAGKIIIDNVETNWRFNNIRDQIVDYGLPLFDKTWIAIKNDYPIDKVVNVPAVDFYKNWYELQSFRDKYLAIRLIYSKFADKSVQLTTNYSIENEQISIK